MVSFCRSVWPSVCGWKAVESRWSMLMWEQTQIQNPLVNCVPHSDMILIGTLCLQITCSKNIRANSGESILFQRGR